MTTKTTVSDLIRDGALTDVRYFEVSGSLRDEPDEELSDDDVMQKLNIGVAADDARIEFKLSADVRTRLCQYRAVVATQVTTEGHEIGDDEIREITSRIGFTVLYPYAREAVHSMAARLRVDRFVMPLIDPTNIDLASD